MPGAYRDPDARIGASMSDLENPTHAFGFSRQDHDPGDEDREVVPVLSTRQILAMLDEVMKQPRRPITEEERSRALAAAAHVRAQIEEARRTWLRPNPERAFRHGGRVR